MLFISFWIYRKKEYKEFKNNIIYEKPDLKIKNMFNIFCKLFYLNIIINYYYNFPKKEIYLK